jgi:hypothetical protein
MASTTSWSDGSVSGEVGGRAAAKNGKRHQTRLIWVRGTGSRLAGAVLVAAARRQSSLDTRPASCGHIHPGQHCPGPLRHAAATRRTTLPARLRSRPRGSQNALRESRPLRAVNSTQQFQPWEMGSARHAFSFREALHQRSSRWEPKSAAYPCNCITKRFQPTSARIGTGFADIPGRNSKPVPDRSRNGSDSAKLRAWDPQA